MSIPAETLRLRLITQITNLPPDLLPAAHELLAHLECGDLSPLSVLECGDLSPLSVLECGDLSPLSFSLPSPVAPASTPISASLPRPGPQRPSPPLLQGEGDESPHSKDWPHAPIHRLSEIGTYIVTAGTLHKRHIFREPERLDLLEQELLSLAREYRWHIEAWAVFSNHYHFVAHSLHAPSNLGLFLTELHANTARDMNRRDATPGRTVWHNFWETQLTFERSYLARLNYVHQNALKHGLVRVANQYRWCSAAWFERTASRAQVQTIYSFKIDRVHVHDDFAPIMPGE